MRKIQGFRKWGRDALDAGRLKPAGDVGRDTQERGRGTAWSSSCSRNARPEKGLVRRPHIDQHGCPLLREKEQVLTIT